MSDESTDSNGNMDPYRKEVLESKNIRISKLRKKKDETYESEEESDEEINEYNNVLNLLIWEGPYFENNNGEWGRIDPRTYIGKILKENILGGGQVYIKSITDIFGKISSKNTAEVLNLTPWRVFCFIATVIVPSCLNSYAITYRWLDRPPRNQDEFHNWSNVALAHIEFAGLVIMFANMITNIILVMLDRTISNRWIKENKGGQSIIINICILLTYISIIPIGSFILNGMYDIFKEEWNFFFYNNETLIENSTDIFINNTIEHNNTGLAAYFDETKLGQLDETFFMILGIYYICALFMFGIIRLNNFRYISEDETLNKNNIVMYDPFTIRQLSFSLKKIGDFSLLKIIAWTKHLLPETLKSTYHKIKGMVKERKEENKSIEAKYIYMFLIFSLPSIFFLILLLLVLIGVGFLGLVIKVKQVAFVGEIEVLDWRLTEWIQFLAFLNNMLALDLSKDQSLKATLNFLFGGQDAIQDMNEMKAKEKFLNMLVAHSTLHNGFLKTIVVLPSTRSERLSLFAKEKQRRFLLCLAAATVDGQYAWLIQRCVAEQPHLPGRARQQNIGVGVERLQQCC